MPLSLLFGARSVPLLQGLSLKGIVQLASAARDRRFPSRETIFQEGDPACHVFLLASGRVKITELSRAGKEVILQVVGRGEMVGGIGGSPHATHTGTAQTIEPCHLYTWRVETFEKLAGRFPVLQQNARNILAERLRDLEERFRDLATEPVPQRLARLLVRLHEQSAGLHDTAQIPLSCEELAQMSGTTLFTVCRLLCGWEEQGIIQREQKVVIIENLPALIEVAERPELEAEGFAAGSRESEISARRGYLSICTS